MAVLVAGGTVAVLLWVASTTEFVRDRAVNALNARFDSQVELGSMEVGVFPTLSLGGTDLHLRHMGRTDVPPLISVGAFEATAGLYGLYGKPFHLRNVTLDRFEIRLPPGGMKLLPENDTRASRSDAPPITLDEIRSTAATLEIASRRPGRLPRVFEIHDLVMTGFGGAEGAPFHAGLTNPIPRGRVETSGTFGPWDAEDPRLTPLSGEFAFKNANMNDIKGLAGTLSSVGRYSGVLQRIGVEGQAEIPDFSIDVSGQQVPLRTQFKAVVDGTNGDTFLERVEARLRETLIIASGSVARTMDIKGRQTQLDFRIEGGRIQDLLELAVKGNATPLTGRVDVNASFLLPAGRDAVIDRLQLEGQFKLASARFTNIDVQQKINMLSRTGRGIEEDDTTGQSVVSNLGGRFRLNDGVLTLSDLTFAVPGASVELAGTYHLRSEQMAFAGNLLLDASLPDTLGGFTSILARAAQPFFRRPGGGSKLPIRIAGPRARPAFGLDVRRAFWFG